MNSKNTTYLIKKMILVTTFALSLFLTTPGAAEGAPRARPDFNRDGFADLVIGVPDEDIGIHENAGLVHVIYGTGGGPHAFIPINNQFITMGNCSWPADGNSSADSAGTRFGSVLAWGDFNGDGFDDLAIGIPDYNAPYQPCGMPQTGLVYILKGSAVGLIRTDTQYLVSTNVDGPFLNVNQDQGDRFGAALAAGNFNGDISPFGFPIDDLAIGTPGEDGWDGVASIPNAGDVYVLYGRFALVGKPLEQHNAEGWSQNGKTFWPDLEDDPQANDEFGASLASGDFNGDGRADLAIGVPGEAGRKGAVNVIYGSPLGLRNPGNQLLVQPPPGVREPGEQFGFSLAAGNFNGDSAFGRQVDDLAIGAPKATVAGQPVAGEVTVIHGSIVGLGGPAQLWSQLSPGIGDNGLFAGDQFGFALASANFNGDAFADLAVGVPFDSPGGVGSAGAVNVIYGSAFGLNAFAACPSQYFYQAVGAGNFDDQFGRYLAVGDFNGNGLADLVVGVPNDRIGGVVAGSVNLVYGAPVCLDLAVVQPWHQNIPGIWEDCEAQDGFGVGARR